MYVNLNAIAATSHQMLTESNNPRDEVHTYLSERQRQANRIQQEAEQRFNPIGIRGLA